ncbi:Gfo/Idh/MocA family protein [Sinomonas sp. P47F7]|uniref:Gfo/Idh/MocA family protein n=1 Tax=Sinomonas sp. P47F7 TaxID=3410987 RepID=UPI003BF5CB70
MTPTSTDPTKPKPLHFAIIGTGGIANSHAKALSAQPGIVLAAAIDIDPGRSAAFAEKWGIAHTAATLAEALEKAEVDAVAICTPPSSHAPLALDALGRGVHVVIEKPPALSLRELAQLREAEAASAGSVSCIFQHRFGAAAERVRGLAEKGALGKPLVGVCNTLWFRDQAYFDVPWRGKWDVEGGGPTMGHGIHQFDLLLHLWGPWREVTAFASKLARRTNTEDVSAAVVRLESGALVTVVNSVISPRESSVIRLDYENASIELEHVYGYTDADWRLTPAKGHDKLAQEWPELGEPSRSSHADQYAAIVASLRSGAPAPVTLAEASGTLELAAAIYASALTGRPITRGEIASGNPFFERMDGLLDPWSIDSEPVAADPAAEVAADVASEEVSA